MFRALKRWLVGGDGDMAMPARVATQIKREQEYSEILIGWMQLSGVTFFAVVYTIAPKTFDADVMFAPVPWALGLYFLFTVVRLILAHGRRLPPWMVTLSVIIDMVGLLVTIWSFHLQYDQEPGFSPKAPTLLYIFILIALRTLRFDARYVILTGASAMAGWLGLLAYALANSPMPGVITRDYVHYTTSSDILIGSEVDKILSMAMVTLVLAVAVARARRLLIRAATEHPAVSDLSRFFVPEVARQIAASDNTVQPGQGEFRDAAILHIDLRGFTTLAHRLAADDVVALLAEYQSRMVPVIQRHGDSIDKFLGDGIMATFGAALATDSYAADSLRAAEALLEAQDAWNRQRAHAGEPATAAGIGVAVVSVVFGAVGDDSRLEYTVIGDAVNLAAKLERHTKVEPARALTTGATLTTARSQVYSAGSEPKMRPARQVAGVEEPIDLVILAV
jgi:adenylate cyclase